MKERYDIFIRYRRNGGFETAKHLNDLLVRDGYTVSFDIDTLREGDFDTALLRRINQCTDFILVVDRHAFDRTIDPHFDRNKDWMRIELAEAMRLDKNVIPILLSEASFPDNLPADVARVRYKNGPKYVQDYFDAFYEKLKSFLHSTPTENNDTVVLDRETYERLMSALNAKKEPPNTETKTAEKPALTITEETPEEWYQKGKEYYEREDYSEAVKWYRKAAEQGHAKAQVSLGSCYFCGNGVPKDETEAVKWYRKAAEQGHAEAQINLGCCYSCGNGVPKDETEAVKWYRKAAEQGYAWAQWWLGRCYLGGWGVPEDETEAVKWWRKAAEQGFAAAQAQLGNSYYWGWGVPKDETEAVKWWRKAAEQGFAAAQQWLGDCYQYGDGVPRDYTEAVKWYRKAAEQGYAKAQKNLGHCYRFGDGVPRDYTEAVKWYRKAAEQGDAKAQEVLGYCYRFGCGVPKDKNEAAKWYRKAAEQGDEFSKEKLEELGYSC